MMAKLDENLIRTIAGIDNIEISINIRGIPTPAGTTVEEYPELISQIGKIPVLAYDWDAKTVLGISAIAKLDDPAEQAVLARAALDEIAEELSDPTLPEGVLYSDNPDYPLTHKKGYSFGKWIDYDAKDANDDPYYTMYGYAVNVTNRAQSVVIPAPPDVDLQNSDYSRALIVKAAYTTNADMEPLNNLTAATAAQRDYSLTFDGALSTGTSGTYTINLALAAVRENNGLGVHRLRVPALRVAYTTESATTFSAYKIGYADMESISIGVVSAGVTQIKAELIDLCDVSSYGGTQNWVTSSVARSNSITLTTAGADGLIVLGAVGYLNDLCRRAKAAGDTAQQIAYNTSSSGVSSAANLAAARFTNAGLDASAAVVNNTGAHNNPGTTAAVARQNALANIYVDYLTFGRNLTQPEMDDAIRNGPGGAA